MITVYKCELCNREVSQLTEHHLVPKERGGKDFPTANLCITCHKQIHALYTNKELAMRLNTIQSLEHDERISKYLRYIRKQPPTKSVTIKKSRALRRKA